MVANHKGCWSHRLVSRIVIQAVHTKCILSCLSFSCFPKSAGWHETFSVEVRQMHHHRHDGWKRHTHKHVRQTSQSFLYHLCQRGNTEVFCRITQKLPNRSPWNLDGGWMGLSLGILSYLHEKKNRCIYISVIYQWVQKTTNSWSRHALYWVPFLFEG